MPKTSNASYNYTEHNPTIADRYYSETWKVRENYKPVNGETLHNYNVRQTRVLNQCYEDSQAHIKWHTHQSAGECWICVIMQTLQAAQNTNLSLAALFKKVPTFKEENGNFRLIP